MSYFGLDKIGKLARLIKHNGGIRMSIYKLYRQDDLRMGDLIGTDTMGNKYYQNNEYFMGRNRWVIYSPSVGTDFEGSMVAPEWFGWIHYKTDTPPTEKAPVNYSFIQKEQTINATGTEDAYMPYSTTKPKVEAWVPPKKSA